MMTAIVAIEELKDLDQEITLTQEMFAGLYEQDATQAGFQPGETVRAIDLLYGVMLPSGAECCIALSYAIAGSEQGFVDLMNKKQKSLEWTELISVTAQDFIIRIITVRQRYGSSFTVCAENDTFREIAESPWHSTPGTNLHPDGITYYSTMFKNLSETSVTGGKILGGKPVYQCGRKLSGKLCRNRRRGIYPCDSRSNGWGNAEYYRCSDCLQSPGRGGPSPEIVDI